MYFLYRNLKVHYNVIGSGDCLVILHGWGVSSSSFSEVIEELKKHFLIITIDFSGFGMSEEPKIPFSLDDYVDELFALISYLKLDRIIILAHSFGGRVAIRYCNKYDVNKLILVDSAGVGKRSIKTIYKIYRYKFLKYFYLLFSKAKLKKIFLQSASNDYQRASSIMKQTMNNIIKTNLQKEIKKIKCQVLILWGYFDTITPLSEGLYIHRHLKKSRLIVFFNSGHFPYLDEKKKFINVITSGGLDV